MSDCPEPIPQFCLNCDNSHGCRTAPALCGGLPRPPDKPYLAGQELMRVLGRLSECPRCPLFRRCFDPEAHRRINADLPREPGG